MSNWSAIAALGEAAKGAGSYFGSLTAMKVKEERLAQARAEKIADVADSRAYQKGVTEDEREHQKGVTADTREYQEGVVADTREYQKGVTAEERDYQTGRTDAQNAYNRETARLAAEAADAKTDAANEEHDRRAKLKQDLKDGKGGDGKEGSDKDMTVYQQQMRYRSSAFSIGKKDMVEVIAEGYDPGGWEAAKDKVAGSTMATRWASSDEGRRFEASASRMKEAALRTATGAAAPQGENYEYLLTLIPSIGESKEVIAWKMKKLDEYDALLAREGQRLDEVGTSDPVADAEAWNAAVEASRASDAIPHPSRKAGLSASAMARFGPTSGN